MTDAPAMTCPRCRGTGIISAPVGLAARLMVLRDARGVTGKAIERATGISHATLHRIMHGNACTTDSLIKLADFFQVSADELLGRVALKDQS